MSDYMAAQMDAQMDGAICENERLAAEVDRLTAEAAELRRERDELVRQNAEPARELPTRCTECGQQLGCSHVAHERGLRVTAHSSDSTSCPRGER